VLALLIDRGEKVVDDVHRSRPDVPIRIAWYGLLTAALLPLAPAPIHTVPVPVPRFFSDGTWRAYVPTGYSLATIPAGQASSRALRWTVATDLQMPMAGLELGVERGSPLSKALSTGKAQSVDDRQRSTVMNDLRYGRVSAVVLVPQRNEDALRATTSSLLGFYPTWVDGVWLWDMRARGVT
jgi:hypothetical protein